MNEINNRKLMQDFPRLLRKSLANPSPLQFRGIEAGDGWFDIVYKLLSDIQKTSLEAGLKMNSRKWPRILQVKEKFGGLRVSINAAALYDTYHLKKDISDLEVVRSFICAAEAKSLETCESCGEPGTLHQGDWFYVKCHECEADHQKRKLENA